MAFEAITEAQSKPCFGCSKTLPLTAFGKKSASPDGRSPRCIPCNRAYMAEYRAANPEKIKSSNERWRRKNPLYAAEWQRENADRHIAANARYRDRVILSVKPSEDSVKSCSRCHSEKLLSEFWVNSSKRDGRAAECIVCSLAKKRFRFFGLTPESFGTIWKAQHGKCGSCGDLLAAYGKGGCVIDHDHVTGDIRALLCSPCNLAIGHLQESPERAERAAKYLRRFGR